MNNEAKPALFDSKEEAQKWARTNLETTTFAHESTREHGKWMLIYRCGEYHAYINDDFETGTMLYDW